MLNQNQKPAVEWLVANVLEDREPVSVLIGQGGSGKTYCIMDVARRLQAAGLKILFTGPTNKSVKQLEKQAKEYGLKLDNIAFMTTHAALGLAVLPNEDRKSTTKAGKGYVELFDVMVIDEASMLSKIALFRYVIPECTQHKTSLIGMGDDLQLPPVKEPVSLIFTEFPCWRLEGNERQKEGPLLTMNGMIRTSLLADRPFKGPEADGEEVVYVPDAKFIKTIVDAFDIDTDLEKQRVIAWSNTRVNKINEEIRKKLFGDNAPSFVEGERVVTGGPIRDPEGQVILGTDEECIVHHVNENSSLFDEISGHTYKTTQLVLNPIFAGGQYVVEVMHEEERQRYEQQVEDLAASARNSRYESRRLWAKYWAFKEGFFADIRHCYCITVHRSQGSSFDILFYDLKDALRNRNRVERQRLIYVGTSRPRHKLYINKRKYVA